MGVVGSGWIHELVGRVR